MRVRNVKQPVLADISLRFLKNLQRRNILISVLRLRLILSVVRQTLFFCLHLKNAGFWHPCASCFGEKRGPGSHMDTISYMHSAACFWRTVFFGIKLGPGSHYGHHIIHVFCSLFLAGSETTAKTLSWAVYFLAKHPEMLSRCREEALRVAPLR